MKKISVIIVSFNTSEILQECLTNLDSAYKNLEIIVVDNASSDDSVSAVRTQFPQVILVVLPKNKGLAAGYNEGLARASGDYILYLGSDAFPKPGVLEGMISFMEADKKLGATTAKLVLRNGSLDMDAHRGFPTPWAAFTHFSKINHLFPKSIFFNSYFLGGSNMAVPHEIDLCIAHFMLVKRQVQNEVGLWDESFFVFGEYVDLCYGIKKAGWKLVYLPQFEVLHYKGFGIGIRKESKDISKASLETKKRMKRETTRAMKLFYEKHYTKVYPKSLTKIVLFGIDILSRLRSI